jgi:hypothetical protein
MSTRVLSVAIAHERDIVIARRRVCQLARLLHFPQRECTRIGTAVSEAHATLFGAAAAEFWLYERPDAAGNSRKRRGAWNCQCGYSPADTHQKRAGLGTARAGWWMDLRYV